MDLRVRIIVGLVMSCTIAVAQEANDRELARLLANETTRSRAVSRILASGSAKIPLLLSWTKTAPTQVDEYQLYVGLADVFGQLRTTQAIPFLIKNIQLSRTNKTDVWLKTAEVVQVEMPAVAALVRIGPAASRAVIHSFEAAMPPEDRLPLIFVVSRIRDPEARAFLSSVLGELNLERSWAEDGLKLLRTTP
jgi:hypothetical protein